ncbi:MAG TPA: hypothetical protein EYO75_08320 [Sulfurimonas sp.]|uniref:Uncharacterized protein n=1 Tax=hydrothermal vent metagenome TaxID=652676 RepID=A0A1W1BWB4_9ZZZZ|nr:hypothetical protein [Sulfurimonas sp.]HIM74671.1 hypothetical protein [Campylobacterales bacterium]
MTNNEATAQANPQMFEVITYEENVAFSFTSPETGEPDSLEHELTFIWEDTIEEFIKEHGADKPYKIETFKRERARDIFLEQVEGRTDDLIEEVQEEIANKMKFGFEFSGQLHNDD